MFQNINIILYELNIKYCDLFLMDGNKMKTKICNKVGKPDWRSDTVKELSSLREKQFSSELNHAEIVSLLDFISTER